MGQQNYHGEQIDPLETDNRADCNCGDHPNGGATWDDKVYVDGEWQDIEDTTDDPRTIGLCKGLFRQVG